jgi:hypothetical protein
MVALKDSRNILPRQDRADVAGEACEAADATLHGENPGEIQWLLWANMSRHGSARARPVYLQQRTYLVTAAWPLSAQKRP